MVAARVSSSFRDPAGFVISHNGLYKRVVTARGRVDYEALMGSGLYEDLVSDQLLIAHREESCVSSLCHEAHKLLCPEQLDYVSYPYEWCFSQLRDAALLTLEVQARALRHGMSLKDASGYNIQFRNCRPIFIDTLSFERDDGGPWIAYEQFCRHFVAPLLLMASRSMRFNQYLRTDLDGFPLDLASRLLSWSTYFRIGPLLHVHWHSRVQRDVASSVFRQDRRPRKNIKANLVDSLRQTITSIRFPAERTAWSEYSQFSDHYPADATAFKKAFVEAVLEREQPRLVFDCGGNSGTYARLAAAQGSRCVLFDSDPLCVELAYRSEREAGTGLLLPLLMDLRNPTPSLGFGIRERLSVLERPKAGLVLTLALLHHLRIRDNIPFEHLASFFSKLGRLLLVEFVMPDDPLVRAMIDSKRMLPDDCSFASFMQAFNTRFRLRESAPIPGMQRCLLLFEATE